MELCNKRQDSFGFFLFFSELLFSSFVFYFGEDIFHKVNWPGSLSRSDVFSSCSFPPQMML